MSASEDSRSVEEMCPSAPHSFASSASDRSTARAWSQDCEAERSEAKKSVVV